MIPCLISLLHGSMASSQEPPTPGFTLDGVIKGGYTGYVYLSYNNYSINVRKGVEDSCLLKDGHFSFKGSITEPAEAHFSTYPMRSAMDIKNTAVFYIEPGHVRFFATLDHFEDFQVTGSVSDKDRAALERMKQPLRAREEELYRVRDKYFSQYIEEKKGLADEQALSITVRIVDSLRKEIARCEKKQALIDSAFIIAHPDSYVAVEILSKSGQGYINFPSLENLYNRLPRKLKETYPGGQIKDELAAEKNIPIGSLAKNIIALDSKGNTINLENYRGKKYILLDFWASWCGPCRGLTPGLKDLYSKYSSSLEIISISNEEHREDWQKALDEDKTMWPQILENKDFRPVAPSGSFITASYTVRTIPSLILLDKDLRIVDIFGNFRQGKSMGEAFRELENRFSPTRQHSF